MEKRNELDKLVARVLGTLRDLTESHTIQWISYPMSGAWWLTFYKETSIMIEHTRIGGRHYASIIIGNVRIDINGDNLLHLEDLENMMNHRQFDTPESALLKILE